MNDHTQTPAPEQRVIRVFVSSTFRDMQAEREELVKRIFPELRSLCERRGVTWGEVDLRWGVTDEQKAEGRVLPICLEEIRGCRPYFIGLLGERYGWIPDQIPPELLEREPWLAEQAGRSVTELEILHGVLNDPEMADNALFYFRSPAYLDSRPELERPNHLEAPGAAEIADLGAERAKRRVEERAAKLLALKQRIRQSGLPLREDYPDPRALGELVLEDMRAIIERAFPAGSEPEPLDREAAEHEAFGRSRAAVYIGRQGYFERLDAHAAGDEPPLAVLGESGLGKSALLANWALRHRANHPDDLVVMHFIGANPASADWAAILRRIMGELKRRLEIEEEIPDNPAELGSAFANWLHLAAECSRVVLVIDALDQLDDRQGAPDLVWLPPAIPGNVRLVCSTLPGRPLDELTKRGWPTLEVSALEPGERKALIVDYLAQYRKTLARPQLERIAGAAQSANPLYLRALLEELRLYGDHFTLEQRIDHYLEVTTPAELYERILARYEDDYERDRPGLVGEAMSLLWAGRRGLSEAELLELLGTDGEPLPRAHWSPLYLAAEQSLVSRSGVTAFFHDHLRRAVRARYLPTEADEHRAHLRLADYFEPREAGERRLDELPWQLAEAGAWERLATLLGDLDFFESAWNHDEFEVKECWTRVETNSALRIVDAYRLVLDDPESHIDHVWNLASLLQSTGHPVEALPLRVQMVEHHRHRGDRGNLQASLGNQALILRERGALDEAMALLKEQEGICRELGNHAGLALSLGHQALVLIDRDALDEAMALLAEQEKICRLRGDRTGLQASLSNQARILRRRGELDQAMERSEEAERICRELGDRAGLHGALANQALILQDRGALDEANALHREQERICRELGDRAGLGTSLGNQGLILIARGELDGAIELLEEAEEIFRELGDRAHLQASLGNRAVILQDRGELDQAMALRKEQERICRELGNRMDLLRSLAYQAQILRARGELEEAITAHAEEERICRELGVPAGLASSLANRAGLLAEVGRPEEAVPLVEEAQQVISAHGLRDLEQQVGAVVEYVRSQNKGWRRWAARKSK